LEPFIDVSGLRTKYSTSVEYIDRSCENLRPSQWAEAIDVEDWFLSMTGRWGNQDGPYFGDLDPMVHLEEKERSGLYELHMYGKAGVHYDQRWVLSVGSRRRKGPEASNSCK